MNEVASTFIYVLFCFILIGITILLIIGGNTLYGAGGAITGAAVGLFILIWAACWYTS